MDLDATLCYCFHIKKRKIVGFVRQTRPRYASQISECFSAGTGCGWCIPFLRKIHRDVLEGHDGTDDISAAEYERLRTEYLADIKAGLRRANHEETDEFPEELRYCAPAQPANSKPVEEEDEDWDVSGYFSRPSTVDPEPETLCEESLPDDEDDDEDEDEV